MNKLDCKEIMKYIEDNYSNFKCNESMFNTWFNELQQYDKDDIFNRLKEMMSKEIYQLKPPTLMAVVKDIPKTQEKIDWSKGVAYCNICGRAFNVGDIKEKGCMDEIHKHENRCRSIKYISRQAKTYKGIEVNKAQLYKMSDDDFNKFYDKVLKYVLEHSTDEMEKQMIGYVFNSPNEQKTKEMFGVK